MKGKGLLAGFYAAALLLSACQASPEDSLVVHKNMENLISEAQTESEGKADANAIREEVSKAERYQTEIENEGLNVKLTVDAEVDVPDVDTLNIYRVRQKKFDQAFVDKVRAALLGDTPVYDWMFQFARTKSSLEENIAGDRAAMRDIEQSMRSAVDGDGNPVYSEEEIEEQLRLMQDSIDALEEEYETAPETPDPADYPTDGKLRTIRELNEIDPENYPLTGERGDPDDGSLNIVTSGQEGIFAELSVQNSAAISNRLHFAASKSGYVDDLYADNGTVLDPASYNSQPLGEGVPENFLGSVFTGGDTVFTPLEGESCTLSEEEALEQAESLLETLGLSDFALEEGGRFSETAHMEDMTHIVYRENYIFKFRREIDGVLLRQRSGEKQSVEMSEGDGSGVSYSVVGGSTEVGGVYTVSFKRWPGELIEIRVNDDGIVGFDYLSPLEVTETVTEGAAMKPFREIREIFEQMLPVVQAENDLEVAIDIDAVHLDYSRISEPDSFDTGLVVPVWSFEGTKAVYDPKAERRADRSSSTEALLAINAIDGPVIVPDLGY